ncbi:MAG: YggS family pyridoxal phosphate-dependent enzyme [bacterium]|nr:YggS family pyridoxal phosphate-dependent enzyme [bacterium]
MESRLTTSPVAARLAELEGRIHAACERCGRDPAEVVLVGIGKRQPLERLRAAAAAGLRVFGENRVREAVEKSAELPVEIEWHLVGPLQSNKVKPAVRLFDAIHSLDRPKIARLLDREAERQDRRLRGFIQVHVGAEPGKHGFAVDGLAEAVRPLAELERIEVVGLMAIPPYEEDRERARSWFRSLRELRDELAARPEWSGFPGWLSMGMSHDFEIAVEEGATHVRVGTALFGPRD